MKSLKIRGKLTLGFGLLLMILIVMNAFSLSNLRSISNFSVDLYTGPHMSALSSVAMLKDVYKIENAVDRMLLTGDARTTEDYENACRNIEAELTAIRETGVIDPALVTDFEEKLSAMKTSYAEISRLLSEQEPQQMADEVEQFEAVVAEATVAAQEISVASQEKAEAFKNQSVSQADRTIVIQDILFAVIVVAALLISYKMSVIITVPLKKLSQGMQQPGCPPVAPGTGPVGPGTVPSPHPAPSSAAGCYPAASHSRYGLPQSGSISPCTPRR